MTTQATELETVQQAMKQTKDKRMHERYQAVSLFLQGYTYAQITKIVGRNEKTVGEYVRAYLFFFSFFGNLNLCQIRAVNASWPIFSSFVI
ncbi:terminase gpP N-terminus-related DNA-binding protein [Ectobacillus funiculus]|uniref:Helix-turn-helix domain-containing protein n=1 Tax=Ectobacillus funiculus TaxID=137993 RepID=A0ABV5WD25_9BACI